MIAGDTQVTCGSVIDGWAQKVFRKGPVLLGAVGDGARCDAFRDWALGGMKGDAPRLKDEHGEADGFLFPGGDLVLWRYHDVWARHRAPFFAYGSGAEIALGAMLAGATAEEAVRAAAQRDVKTGGEIIVLRREG